MKVLFIGDVCGSSGIKMCEYAIKKLKEEGAEFDFIIANGENAAGGLGINYLLAKELYAMGVDVITMGNHTWSRKEILNFIDDDKRLLRPVNFHQSTPGRGSALISKNGMTLGVINAIGTAFMDPNECPFMACDRELEEVKKHTKSVLIDIHAEATSEKNALAWYLDGRVSAVIGTHTHVQTADERILDCGTGFITDVGMVGPYNGVIGVDKELSIRKFISRIPEKYELAGGECQFNGVSFEIDEQTGKCLNIERLRIFANVGK